MPFFLHPLALIGLASLPALAIVYLLRNRYVRRPVSSLMLWLDPAEVRTGGPRIDRLQTPLLFFLELLLLLLLATAAATPFLPLSSGGRPLVVVLDDSFSMLAGGDDSPREAALRDLDDLLKSRGGATIRFVLAGDRPTVLGEPTRSPREAMQILDDWHCRSPRAALDESIALAVEMGGDLSAILVVTDRQPGRQIEERGRLQWRGYGRARDNIAIATAARTHRDGADRVLLEIVNLSDEPGSTALLIESLDADGDKVIKREQLRLDTNEVHRLILQLKPGAGPIRASLSADELAIDNEAVLMPAPWKPVRVQMSLRDRVLREQFEKGLKATRSVEMVTSGPMLLITDGPEEPSGDAWVLRLSSGTEPIAFDGPFVIDKTHPLAEGFSLPGVIWSPGTKDDLPGHGIVLAGNTPLLTDSEDASGRHLVRMRLRHDLSSLLESPSWPVLMTNLVQWRASALPGLSRSTVRLGEEAMLTLERPTEDVRLELPDGTSRPLSVHEGRVVVRGEETGIYRIRQGADVWSIGVVAANREESDLRGCASGRWGEWLDETALKLEYRDVVWILLLAALAVAALHLFLSARGHRASVRA